MSDPQPDYDSVPGWLATQWAQDLREAAATNAAILGEEDTDV